MSMGFEGCAVDKGSRICLGAFLIHRRQIHEMRVYEVLDQATSQFVRDIVDIAQKRRNLLFLNNENIKKILNEIYAEYMHAVSRNGYLNDIGHYIRLFGEHQFHSCGNCPIEKECCKVDEDFTTKGD